MATMLTETDIPLTKMDHPSFKSFINKYYSNSVPDSSTLAENYVHLVFEEKIMKLGR